MVLLGSMGAGKSSVGEALARRLGWKHLDLDLEIERREDRTVAEIFRGSGEARFRELEVELTEELAGRVEVVLSPGGGWILNPGARERLAVGTLFVWLQVSPEEALRRIGAAAVVRPLLATEDPLAALRRLLEEREPHYHRADVAIATDGRDIESIAAEIERQVAAQTRSP